MANTSDNLYTIVYKKGGVMTIVAESMEEAIGDTPTDDISSIVAHRDLAPEHVKGDMLTELQDSVTQTLINEGRI